MQNNTINLDRVPSVADMTARELLDTFDAHIEGRDKASDKTLAIVVAAAFASQAFHVAVALDQESGTVALCRAFLQALVDVKHESLNHLRDSSVVEGGAA